MSISSGVSLHSRAANDWHAVGSTNAAEQPKADRGDMSMATAQETLRLHRSCEQRAIDEVVAHHYGKSQEAAIATVSQRPLALPEDALPCLTQAARPWRVVPHGRRKAGATNTGRCTATSTPTGCRPSN